MLESFPLAFWDDATVHLPETKQQITLRLDPDVIRWFKRTGKGYQSRMGAVLRSYVEASASAARKLRSAEAKPSA